MASSILEEYRGIHLDARPHRTEWITSYIVCFKKNREEDELVVRRWQINPHHFASGLFTAYTEDHCSRFDSKIRFRVKR